jgi:hypothetical protein
MMGVEDMPDERLAHFYENIRQQVEADRANKHQFMANPTVRQYADRLRSELIKRDYITRRSNGPRSIAALTTLPGSRLPRRAALICSRPARPWNSTPRSGVLLGEYRVYRRFGEAK